ncbi:MAG: AMP-binding protein [Dehalococcoidia bacterium]|jgi:long-chain acyl-CoA synthetase
MNNPYASKPWLRSYDKHVPEKLTFPDKLYTDLFYEAVKRVGNRVAIYYSGLPITYDQLDTMTNKFANFLIGQGLEPGDVVGVNLPNVLANYISIIGTLKAGCVLSGVSPLLTQSELEYQLNNSGAKALVTIDVLWGKVSPVISKTGIKTIAMVSITDFLPPLKRTLGKLLKKIPHVKVTPVAGVPMSSYMDIMKNAPASAPARNIGTDANCLVQYTGGTTGVPKGAIITHKNFVSMMTQLTAWFDSRIGKDTMLLAFPLFHMAGIAISMWGLTRGSTMIAVPNPRDYASIIKSIQKYKPSIILNVATLYIELMKLPAFSKLDFSSLDWCFTGAMSMPPEYFRKLEAIVGENKLIEGLGMTETSPLITMGPRYGKKKVGSVGLPVSDTEIKVVDPATGELMPVGEPGELVASGPQVFTKGYHNMPEETAKTLREGWIYTGDIVRMDEEGYVFIVDRCKDMVNVSGFKVFTRELDDLIVEHPAVALAATVGTPNPDRPGAEIVTTAVVLKPGFEKNDATMKSIVDYIREHAAPYKVPKKIVFMDQLPMSAVGKVLKRELREMLKI